MGSLASYRDYAKNVLSDYGGIPCVRVRLNRSFAFNRSEDKVYPYQVRGETEDGFVVSLCLQGEVSVSIPCKPTPARELKAVNKYHPCPLIMEQLDLPRPPRVAASARRFLRARPLGHHRGVASACER